MPATPSPGKALADKLHAAIQDIGLNPALLIHSRPIISGVTSEGKFVGGMTLDQFFAEAGQILLDSHRVFRHGNSICLEIGEADERRLIDLADRPSCRVRGCAHCWRTSSASGRRRG